MLLGPSLRPSQGLTPYLSLLSLHLGLQLTKSLRLGHEQRDELTEPPFAKAVCHHLAENVVSNQIKINYRAESEGNNFRRRFQTNGARPRHFTGDEETVNNKMNKSVLAKR